MKKLLALYRERLSELGHGAGRNVYGDNTAGAVPFLPGAAMAHVRWMLDNMPERGTREGHIKFARWLGFIQGVLWLKGIYTLNQLRNQTRDAK